MFQQVTGTGYKIESSGNGVSFSEIKNIPTGPSNGLVDSTFMLNISPNTGMYYFRMRYYNAGGQSPYSAVISVNTTPGAPPNDLVTALEVIRISSGRIKLAWLRNPDDSLLGFKVERSTHADSGFSLWSTINPSDDVYDDATNLQSGVTYYYRIRSFNSAGDSAPSMIVSAVAS